MIDIENSKLAWEDARKNLQTQYLNAVNGTTSVILRNRKIIICLPKMYMQSPPTVIGRVSLL